MVRVDVASSVPQFRTIDSVVYDARRVEDAVLALMRLNANIDQLQRAGVEDLSLGGRRRPSRTRAH
jgi:hypothetical protein